MTNKEILKKAFEKAEENGYNFPEGRWQLYPFCNTEFVYPYLYYSEELTGVWGLHIFEIIFSHDFAKAFWGEESFIIEEGKVWCDGYLIAENIEQCKLEQGLTENQCMEFKRDRSCMVSSFKSFDSFNEKFVGDWQYHLQKMVLEKEPLKYIEKFLGEDNERTYHKHSFK